MKTGDGVFKDGDEVFFLLFFKNRVGEYIYECPVVAKYENYGKKIANSYFRISCGVRKRQFYI